MYIAHDFAPGALLADQTDDSDFATVYKLGVAKHPKHAHLQVLALVPVLPDVVPSLNIGIWNPAHASGIFDAVIEDLAPGTIVAPYQSAPSQLHEVSGDPIGSFDELAEIAIQVINDAIDSERGTLAYDASLSETSGTPTFVFTLKAS